MDTPTETIYTGRINEQHSAGYKIFNYRTSVYFFYREHTKKCGRKESELLNNCDLHKNGMIGGFALPLPRGNVITMAEQVSSEWCVSNTETIKWKLSITVPRGRIQTILH